MRYSETWCSWYMCMRPWVRRFVRHEQDALFRSGNHASLSKPVAFIPIMRSWASLTLYSDYVSMNKPGALFRLHDYAFLSKPCALYRLGNHASLSKPDALFRLGNHASLSKPGALFRLGNNASLSKMLILIRQCVLEQSWRFIPIRQSCVFGQAWCFIPIRQSCVLNWASLALYALSKTLHSNSAIMNVSLCKMPEQDALIRFDNCFTKLKKR